MTLRLKLCIHQDEKHEKKQFNYATQTLHSLQTSDNVDIDVRSIKQNLDIKSKTVIFCTNEETKQKVLN